MIMVTQYFCEGDALKRVDGPMVLTVEREGEGYQVYVEALLQGESVPLLLGHQDHETLELALIYARELWANRGELLAEAREV